MLHVQYVIQLFGGCGLFATNEAWRSQADARYFAAGDISFKPGVFCVIWGTVFHVKDHLGGSITFKERPVSVKREIWVDSVTRLKWQTIKEPSTDRTVPVSCMSPCPFHVYVYSTMFGVLRCFYGNISEDIGHVHSLWCHVRWCALKDLRSGGFRIGKSLETTSWKMMKFITQQDTRK